MDRATGEQAAAPKQPQWKSRDEHDAFDAMASKKDPNKRVTLAEAFIQKFSNSDFKDKAYQVEMGAYAQLNTVPKAIEAGQKALEANPDNLVCRGFLAQRAQSARTLKCTLAWRAPG